MPKSVETYSMLKMAGTGWHSDMVKVSIEDSGNGSATLIVADHQIIMSKFYTQKSMGEVYDSFMWLASMPQIETSSLLSAGFMSRLNW